MKIMLINPTVREWAKPNVVPLGLGYLASVLRLKGHSVRVLDINANRWSAREVESRIRESDAELFGIGGIVTVYRYMKWLIKLVKHHHPNRPLIIGGSVGTSIPHLILENTPADAVCIGEGEMTILDFCKAIENGERLDSVPGIRFKNNDGGIVVTPSRKPIRDLDTIPFPAWDLFPMDIYLRNPVGAPNRNKWIDGSSTETPLLSMNLSGTRGCPYNCIYCYHDFMGQGWRHRSAANIAAEMKQLHENYDVSYFHFIDDEFCLKKSFVFEFCEEINKTFDKSVSWGCTGRVNLMTEPLVAAMVDAGCVSIGYGIESGSQKMLDVMRKGVTVEQAKAAIRLSQKYLGNADCSFMIGAPGENEYTVQETVDFCKELDLTPEVIFFMTPYPGTALYRLAMEQGKIPDEELYVSNLGEQGEAVRVNLTEMSDEKLLQIQTWMIEELNAWNKLKHPESRDIE